jgi:hypothetical protein
VRKGASMKRRAGGGNLDRWRKSAEFRAIASAQAKRNLAAFAKRPRCGAHRRHGQLLCQQAAMENGRCYLHGGRTPKAENWHRPLWPDGNAPEASAKLARKLHDLDRARKRRDRRIAMMSAKERGEYDAWLAAHRPGAPAARAAERQRKRQSAEMAQFLAEMFNRPPPPLTAELLELDQLIKLAEKRVAEANARLPEIEADLRAAEAENVFS